MNLAHPPHALPPNAVPTRVPMTYMPTLSVEERDRRWDELRKRMVLARVDAVIFLGTDIFWDMGIANIRYIFHAGGKQATYGLFFLDENPILWNSAPHSNRPYNFCLSVQNWTTDIRSFMGVPAIVAELRKRKYERKQIGIVGYSSTMIPPIFIESDLDIMKKMMPDATIVDFTATLEHMRMVKSEEEIGMLRRAGAIGRKVIDRVIEVAKPGVLEAEVFAEMARTQIVNGGEPNVFNLFNSGPVEHPTEELWHLLHGVEQPQVPSMRPLDRGDIIISEIHNKYAGYIAHTEFTFYIGKKAPSELADIFKVCVECLDASRDALRAGNSLRQAWEAIRLPAKKADLEWVELGFHAQGLASPEFPTVVYAEGYGGNGANGHRIGDLEIVRNMCFGNNIDLYNPAWKPDVGCQLADFMVVTEHGGECLVNVPREIGCTEA